MPFDGTIEGFLYKFTLPRRPEQQRQQQYIIDTCWEPVDFQKDLELCREALKRTQPSSPPEDITVALAQGRRSLFKYVFPKFIITPTVLYVAMRFFLSYMPSLMSTLKLKQVRSVVNQSSFATMMMPAERNVQLGEGIVRYVTQVL